MGQVLLVQHLLMRQPMAMKIVQPGRARHGDYLTRFFREAEAAARLKTEHVTRVFDVGYLDDGAPYMIMELLDGKDLWPCSASGARRRCQSRMQSTTFSRHARRSGKPTRMASFIGTSSPRTCSSAARPTPRVSR